MGATRDLARLYECANGTKTINQAVKRHINKFPEQYMFQVNEEEFVNICGPNFGPQNKKDFYHMFLLNKELPCLQLY